MKVDVENKLLWSPAIARGGEGRAADSLGGHLTLFRAVTTSVIPASWTSHAFAESKNRTDWTLSNKTARALIRAGVLPLRAIHVGSRSPHFASCIYCTSATWDLSICTWHSGTMGLHEEYRQSRYRPKSH